MMDADRLRAILDYLDISQHTFALIADWDEREFRRMCAGSRPITDEEAAWIEEIAPVLARTPKLGRYKR